MQTITAQFTPSAEQQDIQSWIKKGRGNGCINAVAGSGKSTTLHLAAQQIEQSGVDIDDIKIIVFGKANAEDLIRKFGERWKNSISTLHSAGWTLIKDHLSLHGQSNLIDAYKYKKIAQQFGLIYNRQPGSLVTRGAIEVRRDDSFLKLLDLVRLTGAKPVVEDIRKIIDHYDVRGIKSVRDVAPAISMCLKEGLKMAANKQSFDFADQVWIPSQWNLKPKYPLHYVLVDECQDLNFSQLSLVKSLAGANGRVLAVGDRRQAIFGFAGADCEAYDKIISTLSAQEFPLSTCYRCPVSHVLLVNNIFPEIPIIAKPNAIEGTITKIKKDSIADHLQENDLVICRMTAPLVSLCIKLIAASIPATVKGRDIGAQLAKEIDTIDQLGTIESYQEFILLMDFYKSNQIQKYTHLDDAESKTENLKDRCGAIKAVYLANASFTSSFQLKESIKALFSDNDSYVTLATCHRTKGLEAERVFIYQAELMPMRWKGQGDWQFEQEQNLLYVALTRSKKDLYIVTDNHPSWI